MPSRSPLRALATCSALLALTACAGEAPTAVGGAAAPAIQGGDGGGSTAPAPVVANVGGNWTALSTDPADPKYNQRLSLRVDQRGTALSGQYESVYLCCPESNHKYKFTGSINAAGAVTLTINVGAGDGSVTFNGTVSADRASITGAFTTGGGSSAPVTFTR